VAIAGFLPSFRGSRAAFLTVALGASASGCAATTGTLYGLSGEWPTTSTIENKHWIEGLPTTERVVEARLESPPRAICETHRNEPAARIICDRYGMDTGGRLAYGFFGLAELRIGAALAFVPRAADSPACIGCDVTAVFFGVDGIASLLMAFLIPDTDTHREYDVPPQTLLDPSCPADVAFEAAGHAFPVQPDGNLLPEHGRALMFAVVETGSAIALRFGDQARWIPVPPETRCAWAVEFGSALAPALCPHAPGPPLVLVPLAPP